MLGLCAKPTCATAAVRYFDIAAEHREVVERDAPTPSTIALCEEHANRFSVPAGWRFDELTAAAPSTVSAPRELPRAPIGTHSGERSTPARNRRHERETPWFLAGSTTTVTERVAPSRRPAPQQEPAIAPTTGSLLHRAFHGPDRDVDVARIAERDTPMDSAEAATEVAKVGDLSTKRASREVTGYDIELPFPPYESEAHVAVS